MGLEPNKNVMWSVGDVMQKKYADQFGRQPTKDNRPKTNGGGSHCFALYPDDWYDVIATEIRKHEAIRLGQYDMFADYTSDEDDEK